jgi:hypothetical protein
MSDLEGGSRERNFMKTWFVMDAVLGTKHRKAEAPMKEMSELACIVPIVVADGRTFHGVEDRTSLCADKTLCKFLGVVNGTGFTTLALLPRRSHEMWSSRKQTNAVTCTINTG